MPYLGSIFSFTGATILRRPYTSQERPEGGIYTLLHATAEPAFLSSSFARARVSHRIRISRGRAAWRHCTGPTLWRADLGRELPASTEHRKPREGKRTHLEEPPRRPSAPQPVFLGAARCTCATSGHRTCQRGAASGQRRAGPRSQVRRERRGRHGVRALTTPDPLDQMRRLINRRPPPIVGRGALMIGARKRRSNRGTALRSCGNL